MSKEEKTKDQVVQELFEVVRTRKAEIEKTERAKWLTNCSIDHDGRRMNLQTVNDVDILINIAGTIIQNDKVYQSGSEFLLGEVKERKLNGFTSEEWLTDIKTRLEKVQLSKKKQELDALERRLDSLVSKEMREQLELEAIKKELNV